MGTYVKRTHLDIFIYEYDTFNHIRKCRKGIQEQLLVDGEVDPLKIAQETDPIAQAKKGCFSNPCKDI